MSLGLKSVDLPHFSQNNWTLDDVLPLDYAVPPQVLEQVPSGVHENFCTLLSRDVYSEGDAQVLYDHILARQAEMSAAFVAMLKLWLEDEQKHYQALRRTYRCIAGVSFAQMDRQFAHRQPDFKPIQRVLRDEFTLLVTLMFDEIGSVYSYRRDLQEYYQHFGGAIRRIGHHLVRDEGTHFGNAAELLQTVHDHRLYEVPELLRQISQLEQSLGQYHCSFFLDHAQEQYRFPPEFNATIIQIILARLNLGQRPSQKSLQRLWQWVPTGHRVVPVRMDQAAGV
ncbi:hypothetical protein [Lyngbya confervoides]|uniref:Ferritin-like domain-containing protein n=1 Tax=Lyngbya confervoides BDU141951 TaxID=1574623 RepID=A0ABD4T0N9_9CYAN|nr:hypothetical protein [Lyngbya confervoides]MCM1982216.1 hypothetical protein [Lyngbya confervoides BDU141951]